MNSTRAAEVICHALWPGPGVPSSFDFIFASAASEPRAELPTYASKSASRCSILGSALAGAAADGAALVAGAVAGVWAELRSFAPITNSAAIRLLKTKIFFMVELFQVVEGCWLNGFLAFFFGADADGVFNVRNEHLAVPNF